MKYAISFSVLAACLIGLAIHQGGWFYMLLWPALTLVLLAAGYVNMGTRVLGKGADGTIPWWAVVVFLPYLLPTWGLCHFLRVTVREDCCNEIVPRFSLGRRPLAHEVPPGIDLIVDLT